MTRLKRLKRQIAAIADTSPDKVELLTTTGTFFKATKKQVLSLYWYGVGHCADNVTVLYISYNTIVGLTCLDSQGNPTTYRTTTKYSVTTSRHCNRITSSKGLSESELYQLAKTGVQP